MVAPLWALNTKKKLVLPEIVDQSSPNFLGDATPKTSHPAKFHPDRSNQFGEKC